MGYFKFKFNELIYEFLAIVEENKKPNEYSLILKGIDNFISQQYIDFLYLKIKTTGSKSKATLFTIVNPKLQKKITIDFLISLLDISVVKKEDVEEKPEEFWTVRSYEEEEDIWEDMEGINLSEINHEGII